MGRASHRRLSTLFACLLVSCAHGDLTPPYQLSGHIRSSDSSCPEAIRGFRLQHVEDYEAPELGFRLNFRSTDKTDIRADVFVYPIALTDLFSLSQILDLEQEKLDSEIALVSADQGVTASAPSVTEYYPLPGGTLLPGLRGYRELIQGEDVLQSHSFLTVNHNLFFKLRMTFPDTMEYVAGDRFGAFISVVSESLKINSPPQRKLKLVVTRTATDIAAEGNPCVLAAWMLYGFELLKALQRGEYLDTFQRELAARTAALDYWEERSGVSDPSTCASGALAALSLSRKKGFLEEYVWEAYRRGHWSSPDGLDTGAFIDWARSALPRHDPIEFPGVLVRWED